MPDVADVLAGRYELRGRVPSSGPVEAFLAWDKRERRDVVIKTYVPARLHAGAIQRYKAAINAARKAPHPAVILPIDLSIGDGPPFAVFEPLTGEDLEALRARVGVFAWARAFELVARCAEALATVTTATGIFHGALQPANLWISVSGEAQLLDLGAAELGVQPVPPRDGKVFVEYRAPEQLDGSRGSARSDIYTLGVLLFEMLTGSHPFSGSSTFMATHAVALAPMPTLQAATTGVPATAVITAQQLLNKALARDPKERFADMGEMARALDLARRTIGSPIARPTENPTPVSAQDPAPANPAALKAIEDPTTMMRIPVVRMERYVPPASAKRPKVSVFESPPASPTPSPPVVAAAAPIAEAPVGERTEVQVRVERPLPERVRTAAPREELPVDRTEVLERRPPAAVRAKAAAVSHEEPHTLVLKRATSVPAAEVTLPLDSNFPGFVPSDDGPTELVPRSSPLLRVLGQAGGSTADATQVLSQDEQLAVGRAVKSAAEVTAAPSEVTASNKLLLSSGASPWTSRRILIVVNAVSIIIVLVGLVIIAL
jgi:serine/threonine protein kinase